MVDNLLHNVLSKSVSYNMRVVSQVYRKGIYIEASQTKQIREINELVRDYKEVEAIKLEETIKQGSTTSASSVKESFEFIAVLFPIGI